MLAQPMTVAQPKPLAETPEGRKVAFICSKGTLDMAYPALVMGWAALGNGIDVTIFFTFWGLDIITRKRQPHLQLSPIGNSSMKMGEMGIPNIVGMLPGMTAVATKMMQSKMNALQIPRRERIPPDDGGRRRQAVRLQDVGGFERSQEGRFRRGRAGHRDCRRLHGYDRRRADRLHLRAVQITGRSEVLDCAPPACRRPASTHVS